jgi:hypothetical protein
VVVANERGSVFVQNSGEVRDVGSECSYGLEIETEISPKLCARRDAVKEDVSDEPKVVR